MKTFIRLWILFFLTTAIHPMQAQRRSPDYRITPENDAILQLEECREWIHTAWATLEETDNGLFTYIHPEAAPFIDLRTFHLEDSTKPLSPRSAFANLTDGESFFRVAFPCKPEYTDTYPHSYVAMVYLKKSNGMPFCLKLGNSQEHLPLTFQEKPTVRDSTRIPLQIDVPKGNPTLTKEERELLLTTARRFVEEQNPEAFHQLMNVFPIITLHQLHSKDGNQSSFYRVRLFCQGSIHVDVSIRSDNKQATYLRFESAMP